MSKRTCTIDGCAKQHSHRGMCQMHVARLRSFGSLSVPDRVCQECPTSFKPCGPKRFCSKACRYKAESAAKSAKVPAPAWSTCKFCDGRFQQVRNNGNPSAYCSPACRPGGRDLRRQCVNCGVEFLRRSRSGSAPLFCTKRCWASSPAVREELRRKAAIRRSRLYGCKSEPVSERQVFERDGWVCGICGEAVDPEAPSRDPLSPSLDHIIPLARGGAHVLGNVQLTHLLCNMRKSWFPAKR